MNLDMARRDNTDEVVPRAISAVTDRDEALFRRLLAGFHWPSFPLSYEGSFAFYSHRAGYFPMKFYDGRLLIVFCPRDGGYSLLRPLGQWHPSPVAALTRHLFEASQRPVNLVKLTHQQFLDLSSIPGFGPVEETQNLADLGDDRYPQLIIPVQKLLRSVEDLPAISAGDCSAFSYLRRILRIFERQYGDSFALYPFHERHLLDVEHIIFKWKTDFFSRYRRGFFETAGDDRATLSLPDNDEFLVRPYQCLLHRFCTKIDMRDNHGFVAYLRGEPVGFLFLSRTSPNCAALYANLSLTTYRGLPYYLLYRGIKQLATDQIDYVNLGGQETNSLRRFYSRFNPFPLEGKETRCYDLRYDGRSAYMQPLSSVKT